MVILLGGFPEFGTAGAARIAPLASGGFRVVVPDQRGYNQSSKPQGWQAYTVPMSSGSRTFWNSSSLYSRAHDWGGVIAWACATGIKSA